MSSTTIRQRRAGLICDTIAATGLPRNQIAAVAGLTNTFIKDLEQGNIANVDRKKLLRLGVALNLNLNKIDEMLRVFDRASLSSEDIETFIESAYKRKPTTAVYPHRNFYAYELAVYAMEYSSGNQVVVNDRPFVCLREPGHRIYSDSSLVESHPLYGDLMESLGKVRRKQFLHNLENNRITLYLCRQCIEDYMDVPGNPEEEGWRKKHVANLLSCYTQYDNLEVKITGMCSYMLFTIKESADNMGPQFTFCAKPGHYIPGERPGRLAGFSTRNPVILQTFRDELESIKGWMLAEYGERAAVEQYLESLIS